MKKKTMLLTVVVVLALTGTLLAQDGGLHGSFDITYQSKYVWRGFDIFGDKSAFQPTLDLDLYGTGFGVSASGHRANSSGFEQSGPGVAGERWDYTLYYQQQLFGDSPWAAFHRVGWVYYNYPETDAADYDLQELHNVLAFPKLLPVKGLVPAYVLVKLWPHSGGSLTGSGAPGRGTSSGWAHIMMLDYGLPVPSFIPSKPEQILKLHAEVVYNDGVHPGGGNADHDWSNAVFGISTDFDMGNNMTFTPGVYHQVTMDKSVNTDKDETWMTASLKYKF